jgi:phosphopantothenoylcysteine decarboxylase/phosphopantothenate--cysteine ligase
MADRILLGITGSVAAFKGVALASMMSREGCEVDCILSSGGLRFVTPWQVSGVTGRPCRSELFDDTDVAVSPHLELTESVELMVVAPASADFLARLAAGLAGQLLTAAALAYEGPLVAAPAMNAPCKHLAADLDVRCGTRINAVARDDAGRWTLTAEDAGPIPDAFDALVLAMPAPQIVALLGADDPLAAPGAGVAGFGKA